MSQNSNGTEARLRRMDEQAEVHRHLKAKNVEFYLNEAVTAFE